MTERLVRKELRTLGLWATVIGIVVAVVTLVVQWPRDDSDTARRDDCREKHGAPVTAVRSTFSSGTWADCAWPPPEGAATDGYGVIKVSRQDNGAESSAGYEGADVFDTSCGRVELQYRHDQQGNQVVSRRASFDTGQVLGLTFSDSNELRLRPVAMPAFVDLSVDAVAAGKLVVVVPIAVQVERVRCS